MSDNKDKNKQNTVKQKEKNEVLIGGAFSTAHSMKTVQTSVGHAKSTTWAKVWDNPSETVKQGTLQDKSGGGDTDDSENTDVSAVEETVDKAGQSPIIETPPAETTPAETPLAETTEAVRKTLRDIEQDIANANFDISDVREFGDHDTPEVDSIDISQDAQFVLDKVQNKLESPEQDSTQPFVAETSPPPKKPDTSASDFIKNNTDKFKQAVENHNIQQHMQTAPAPDDNNLSFDFDIENIQMQQSPVKKSMLAIVFNFTIFISVLLLSFGGIYYLYMEKLQVKPNVPVVLQAQQNIKVRPITQTGMKIENLDKDVYNIIDEKKDLNTQVRRLRPLPENLLPLPTATQNGTQKPQSPVTHMTTKSETDKVDEKTADTSAQNVQDMTKPQKTDGADTIVIKPSVSVSNMVDNRKNTKDMNTKDSNTKGTITATTENVTSNKGAKVEKITLVKPVQDTALQDKQAKTNKDTSHSDNSALANPETPVSTYTEKQSTAKANKGVALKTETVKKDVSTSGTMTNITNSPDSSTNSMPNVSKGNGAMGENTNPKLQTDMALKEMQITEMQITETQTTAPPKKKIGGETDISKPTQPPLPFTVANANSKQKLGWRVQVASLTRMQDAQQTYAMVQKKYAFLKQIPFHVEKATVKGKIYYRLQAVKFTDKSSAIAICKQIKQAKGSCIVKK